MPAPKSRIDRLYEAINKHVTPDTHGGDILDQVKDIVGRSDFRYYDELTLDEIERVIRAF